MRKDFEELCNTPSDINHHLPMLKKVADRCTHITEFGVRDVVSTYAFIESKGRKVIRAYDIHYNQNFTDALAVAAEKDKDLKFIIADTREVIIEDTQFLFIDTLHTYEQLKSELSRHAPQVSKYIGFHDVVTFGYTDEGSTASEKKGLLPAIFEFLTTNQNWRLEYFSPFNNGLLILAKK